MNILFLEEKMFNIDEVYNSQNDEVWWVNRATVDTNSGIGKFLQKTKVMIWLGVCSKGVSALVIFESDTLDHDQYIKEVLPVVLKYDNDMFGDD